VARSPAGIDDWIRGHLRADAPRPRSLIVTMFGDSVAPYSDGVWLSDLIEMCEPFGANERLVRTSVFRLTRDGWLKARREGRRSYYTLAPGGRRRFQHAYDRVYTPAGDWDGRWAVVVVPERGRRRLQVKSELEWEGYGALAPGVFLRPGADARALREILGDLGVADRAIVLVGASPARDLLGQEESRDAVAALVAQCWELARVGAGYRRFLGRFQPVRDLIARGGALLPARAFVVQTLLIDSYRRLTCTTRTCRRRSCRRTGRATLHTSCAASSTG